MNTYCKDSVDTCPQNSLSNESIIVQDLVELAWGGNFDLPDDDMGFEGFEGFGSLDGCE